MGGKAWVSVVGSTPPGGVEGPRTLDYVSGGRPWNALEGAGRRWKDRCYRGLRPINTAYLSAVE